MKQIETTGLRELSDEDIKLITGGSQEELIAEYNLTIGALEVINTAKETFGPALKALGQLF